MTLISFAERYKNTCIEVLKLLVDIDNHTIRNIINRIDQTDVVTYVTNMDAEKWQKYYPTWLLDILYPIIKASSDIDICCDVYDPIMIIFTNYYEIENKPLYEIYSILNNRQFKSNTAYQLRELLVSEFPIEHQGVKYLEQKNFENRSLRVLNLYSDYHYDYQGKPKIL